MFITHYIVYRNLIVLFTLETYSALRSLNFPTFSSLYTFFSSLTYFVTQLLTSPQTQAWFETFFYRRSTVQIFSFLRYKTIFQLVFSCILLALKIFSCVFAECLYFCLCVILSVFLYVYCLYAFLNLSVCSSVRLSYAYYLYEFRNLSVCPSGRLSVYLLLVCIS